MLRSLICVCLCALCSAAPVSAYPISTPFSSYQVLDESEFFSRYTTPLLVTKLYDKGDNAQPNSWLIRGYFGGGGFWEDVTFAYEVGGTGPYPILRTGGSATTTQPVMAISMPFTLADPVPLAVYTDQGFLGIVPDGDDDRFYPLYPSVGRSAVTTVFSISTVLPIVAREIPEPSVIMLLLLGLFTAALNYAPKRAESSGDVTQYA